MSSETQPSFTATVPAVTDGERVVGICTVCQVPLSTGNAHDAGFGSCGEEMFTCLDHCAECTPPHARHVRTS